MLSFLLLGAVAAAQPVAYAEVTPASAVVPTPPLSLEVDERLRKNVDFWITVYTRYNSRQGLIHDAKYIDHVYQVLDLSAPGRSGGGVKVAKRRWREALLSLHRKQDKPDTWTPDERKIAKLYEDIDEPNKYLNAAHRKRLRFQLGQKDNFLSGLVQSGRYLPAMEEVFRAHGMPPELTRLPFVESSFNVRARSKVGASGIWQFMRSTAKLFITMNDAVDERNDPIRAAEAAAKLLRGNYESLGNWPLAVTAYNHGRKGLMRAVRRVGSSELPDLMQRYRARSFGFASSNFYPELLASIEIERNAEKYFGKIERAKPLPATEVRIPHYVAMADICQFLHLEQRALQELNPALSDAVYKGELLIPAGYRLRLPTAESLGTEAQARVFLAGYEQIPDIYKLREQKRSHRASRASKKGRSNASYAKKRPRRHSM